MPFESSHLGSRIALESNKRIISFSSFATNAKRIPLAVVFNFVAIALFVLVGLLRAHYGKAVFWDAYVYSRGIRTYLAGGDPYLRIFKLNFVYPPLFLKIGSLALDLFPLKATAYLYLLLHCIAVLSVPFLLVKAWVRIPWLTASLALTIFLCQPGMVAEQALFSGNISGILYAAALIAGIPGIRQNRWTWFYFVVLSGSLIKIPFATLLLLPLLLGESQLLKSAATAAATLLGTFLQKVAWPDLYRNYVDAVRFQVINRADYGFGIVGSSRLYHLGSHVPLIHDNIGYVLHIALVGALVLGLCVLRRVRRGALSGDMWNAAVLVTALLINPRLKPYDVDIVVLPALVLVVEGFRAALRQRVQLFLIVLPLLSFAVLLTLDLIAAMFCFLVAPLLLIMTESFRPQPSSEAQPTLSSVEAMGWIDQSPTSETTA
jgi:hypothetical protein